jgi:hypothetical protein
MIVEYFDEARLLMNVTSDVRGPVTSACEDVAAE